MFRKRTTGIALLVGALLTSSFAPDASAYCTRAYCQQHVNFKSRQIIGDITTEIGAMETEIARDIAKQTGDISKFFTSQIKADSRMYTQMMQERRQKRIQEQRLESAVATRDRRQTCVAVSSTIPGGTTADTSDRSAQNFTQHFQSWQQGLFDTDKDGKAERGVSRESQYDQYRLRTWKNNFCDPAAVRAGICSPEEAAAAQEKGLAGADSSAGKSLFNSENLGAQRVQAARQLIQNAVQPDQGGMIPKNAAESSRGRAIMADRKTDWSRRSLGKEAMHAVLRRAATGKALEKLDNMEGGDGDVPTRDGETKKPAAWAQGVAKKVPALSPQDYENGVSQDGYLKARVFRVAMNPGYLEKLGNGDSVANQLGRLGYGLAAQNALMWHNYKMTQKNTAANGSALATLDDLADQMEEQNKILEEIYSELSES